jgi:hypothetical protein
MQISPTPELHFASMMKVGRVQRFAADKIEAGRSRIRRNLWLFTRGRDACGSDGCHRKGHQQQEREHQDFVSHG